MTLKGSLLQQLPLGIMLLNLHQAELRSKLTMLACSAAIASIMAGCGGADSGGAASPSPGQAASVQTAAANFAASTETGATQTAATVTSATTWAQCAVEDTTCNVTGTNQVRYGLNGTYVTKTFTGPVACNNATFGDPYPGVDKVCEYMPAVTAPTTWTRCATEGGTCAVSGTKQVRYGLNTSWTTKLVTGSVACTNAVFGDPYKGVTKVCEVTGSTTTTPAPTPATNALPTDSIFASTSFWYKPIPTSVTLHANSSNYVKEFLRQKAAYYGTVNVATYSYASPFYVAPAGAATKTVKVWDCTNVGYTSTELGAQWTAVPIPANAQPSQGTDGEMAIYQPSTNTMWEFWQTKNVNGQWQACWGGRMQNTSGSQGIWPHPFGTTATGLPFVGGQVTAEELKRGEIRHVIGIALVDLEKSSIFYWPANRSDGYNPTNAPNRIPEGTRFRLDPSVNVDALPMTKAGKIIAKAAQKYGFVVWDHSGAISIRAQNAVTYTAQGQSDPYPALYEGKAEYGVLDGFPWDKLQFLPANYGKQ
jgi:hypothetical protein